MNGASVRSSVRWNGTIAVRGIGSSPDHACPRTIRDEGLSYQKSQGCETKRFVLNERHLSGEDDSEAQAGDHGALALLVS